MKINRKLEYSYKRSVTANLLNAFGDRYIVDDAEECETDVLQGEKGIMISFKLPLKVNQQTRSHGSALYRLFDDEAAAHKCANTFIEEFQQQQEFLDKKDGWALSLEPDVYNVGNAGVEFGLKIYLLGTMCRKAVLGTFEQSEGEQIAKLIELMIEHGVLRVMVDKPLDFGAHETTCIAAILEAWRKSRTEVKTDEDEDK